MSSVTSARSRQSVRVAPLPQRWLRLGDCTQTLLKSRHHFSSLSPPKLDQKCSRFHSKPLRCSSFRIFTPHNLNGPGSQEPALGTSLISADCLAHFSPPKPPSMHRNASNFVNFQHFASIFFFKCAQRIPLHDESKETAVYSSDQLRNASGFHWTHKSTAWAFQPLTLISHKTQI